MDYVFIFILLFIFMVLFLEWFGIVKDMYFLLNVWLLNVCGGIVIVILIMVVIMVVMFGIIGGEVVFFGLIVLL